MPLKINSIAPDFSLPSSSGKMFHFHQEMKGKPCILFFYPKDFTGTCTTEVCSFRDDFASFRKMNIDVIGVSPDNVLTHLKFIQEYALPFQLLADEQKTVAKTYGSVYPFIGLVRRSTFLIDENHKIVQVYENLLNGTIHTEKALAWAKNIKP